MHGIYLWLHIFLTVTITPDHHHVVQLWTDVTEAWNTTMSWGIRPSQSSSELRDAI
jgi:hypothetical protein